MITYTAIPELTDNQHLIFAEHMGALDHKVELANRKLARNDITGRFSYDVVGQVVTEAEGIVTVRNPGLTSGHLTVQIKGRSRWVHHLVLEAFVGPCPPGLQCRHLNDVGTDNRLENLVWGTSSENAVDMVNNGNHHYAREERCGRGHLLAGENLLRASSRQCRACNAGRSAVRDGRATSVQEYADKFFQKLGGGAPSPRGTVTTAPREGGPSL